MVKYVVIFSSLFWHVVRWWDQIYFPLLIAGAHTQQFVFLTFCVRSRGDISFVTNNYYLQYLDNESFS